MIDTRRAHNTNNVTTTRHGDGPRRNFFHLCGSPISTPKLAGQTHRQSFEDAASPTMGSPDQVRSPEALMTPPPLHMKDVGASPNCRDKIQRRGSLATAATEQDDLFADYDGVSSLSFSMDDNDDVSSASCMQVDSDDDYESDDGAETDTNSSTHMRVSDAQDARIPFFLSNDVLSPNYNYNMRDVDSDDSSGYSRVGGRRASLTAVHESIDLKDLALDKVIGEGAFGKVYKGTWRHKPVAVKVLLHQDLRPDVVREFETEVQIMSVLNHPNICMLLGACLEPSSRALVLELVEQGSLWVVLRSRRRQLTDAMRAKFILDTALGMNYLHQFKRPILHRDMKSPNLLVQNDFSIKISDFGLSRVKAQIQTMTGNCGTVQWMAPEVLGNQKYTEKADVFSFGIVIWEIVTGKCPYDGMVQIQAALGVLNHDLRPKIPDACPRFFARLMRACWNREPSMRPSFAEIVKAFELYQKSVSATNYSR